MKKWRDGAVEEGRKERRWEGGKKGERLGDVKVEAEGGRSRE